MKTIGEYRARYPQLRELTDYQLTRAVYDTTAPDMPLEDFAKAFGGVTEEDPEELKIQEYNLSHPDDPIRREDMGKASLLSDTGHGIAAGINELAAIPFWLAEEAGIESAGKAKDYFLKSAEEKRKGYSPEMKLAQTDEFFTEEPDGSYGLGGAWTSPRKILGSVAESAPGMVGGMGLSALAARGLMKAGFSRGLAWAVGSSLGEGTIGGAQNALDVHEAILAMPEDKLAASPEYQEILQRTGDPKRAREELANSVAAMTGLKTGASTAVLSAPSGYMFGKILGGETGKTLLGTAAKQGAAEFGEEAGQSGAEQYLSQAELQRADPTIDPMSGVGEAAVSGGFAGMAMGGGMGGFGHVLGGRAQQQPGAPAVSDAQPVLPPEQQAALPEGGHGSPLELGPGQNIVMGTDRAYEDPIATPPPTSPLQKGMEAILGGPLGLSTAPAAPDFAVTPGGRAVSANGIVQPDAFGPIAAGMRSDMPPLLADQVYDVDYSVVPDAPKALSEAPRGLPLGQDKSPVAPESPQPVAVQTDGESTPLQLTHINDKSFMLHGDTGPFEEAIKAAGGRLDRKVGGWRFPLAREGEIRELFSIPLGTETVPGNNLVSEASEASPDVLRETPLPVSGDMAMSGQTGLEVTHGGLQQGTTRTGTGELLSEPVRIDTTGNPGELDAVTGRPGDFPMGDRGSRPDMDTAVPGAGGTEAGLGAVVQRAAGPVEIPAEGVDASLLSPDRRNVPDGGAGRYAERGRAGRGFEGHGQMGRDVPGGSERAERAALEGNGTQGVEQKLLRAIERQNGELTPEAEAWARSLPPERQEAAWQQLTLDAFKGYTASNLRVDEASLKFIPLSKETNTSLQLKALANVFGQDLILFRDASKQPTGILGATVPAINNVIFMEENREGYRPHLSVLGHEMLHNLRNGAPRLYNEFKEYLLSEQKPDTLQRYREDLDRRTGHDGTVGRMSDDKILEEIGADLVGKRLTEESFWAKMAEERPSLFARVSQFVRDLLDRVTAAFRADPLPAAWVKDFDAIRRHIDAMMGQWAEKNARAKTGGTPPHSENTREVLDGRDETVRNAGRNGGEGSDHAGGLLQSNRGRHGAPVDLVGDGGRGGDGGRAAQPAPEGWEGERPRQPVAVKIPNRADEPAHYELLEAEDVRASHLPSRGFQKNPAYGLENERRYHDEPGSRAKVMENAAKLDPAFLMESVDANHGAPVIDHDNNVLGGNGRAMSIARAYESFPERGEQYREALKANADRLGIDPAQVDAMHSPMLVRRLERGMSREERQRLVTVMNDDFKDAKEKRASGKSRGERFGRRTLDMLSVGLKDAESLREYFDTPASAAVVERMVEDGVLQRSERNAYVGADGLLNPDGKNVVEEALRGRIARSYEALAKLPADVVGKLDAVIPHILVAEGIGKPWNITEHVRDSVDLLVGFKGSGVKEPDTYLKQVNMLTGRAPVQDFSKQAIALFRMALDAKKGEYVKAFESYLKNAKLSPEAGNIPGVAKPQDKAFRDAFGMKTEAMSNKPEKREAEKPQTEEETKGQPPEEEISSASKSKKEPQEQTSGKPGDAGHVERHRALYKSLLNGKASLEDYHRGFSALLENEEAVRAELSGMTVNALLARGGAMFAWRHKGDKKADIVDALYRDMLSDFTLGQPYSVSGFMGMGPEEYRKATVASIRRIVDAQSEQTLADFARDAAAQREEYASRRKAEREAVENPKTLEDFRSFILFHMDEGKTASEARDLLSFEQREQFDRLAAEASRSTRKTKAEPVLSSSSQTTGGEIIATKHTQKGHDLFVVRLEDRVSREDYLALLSSAKKLGGYYSKFRGNGAVPGFQFTGREQAEAFLKLAQGDKAEAQEAVKARRDAYEDDRSQTAVQRLNEMADRLDEDADASLNAARKVNTAKRAGQAAAADAMAYADKSLAKTMRNIARAIGNGTATFLDRVREKKQVEQLRDALRMAKWEEDKTKYPAWDQREKHSEEPATTQTVEFAAFPLYRLYRSSWAELGRKLSEKDGTKSLGKKILSVADDVTETYLEFARSHLEEVSTYATQAGKPAVFKSREDAEKAIARSGYRGKAVVLPMKRGENRIILSPSAAQERGIWKGDDDRMLSLRPDLVDELFDKQGSTSRDIPWQLSDIRQKRKALARMGIETPAEYRMALREFVGLQAAAKQDKVRELERSVMRDAANNRGWLDFFPTPVAVTEEMLAAADIRPGMAVLEPSAGMGHIADRIREKGVEPVVAELEPQKRELLEAKGYEVVGKDFMKDVSEGKSYDRIAMNPPFSKRQDTEHVRRAYDLLKPGGRLVAIVSEGSFFGKDSKAAEFRDWLEEVGGTSEKLAEGSFNDPSLPVTTGVNTRMVVIEKEGTPMASVTPGEFLPAMPSTRIRIRKAAVQSVADALGKRAANAADTRVVQSFEELPEHIRQLYGEVSSRLEGVYDPASGTVYLVADNLCGTARAAEVWMHENMVHHGLNGLLGMDEKRRVLNRLWQGMGGMGNAGIASIARKYGVDPRWDVKDRALVMEEYLARLAEKQAAGKLSGQEQTLWRRFVEAVLRAWHALTDAVTGRMGSMKYENVDRLLSALDRYVFEGRPEGMAEGGMVPAMASKQSDPNNARFSPDTGKKTDFVTLPDGSVDFAQFPATRLKDMRLLRAAPIRLPRGIHSLSGGYGLTHIEANHGNEIRAAGYGSVQEFVWDLVNGYNEIWEGEKRSLLILKNNGKTSRPAGFIELEKDGSHYIVKNAYPVDMNYPTAATRKQLWKSAPPSSSTSGEQTPSNPFTPGIPSKDQTGNLQGQRGQSSKENIQQGRVEDKPLASLRDIKDVRDITGMSAEDAMNLAKNDPWIGSIFGKSDDVTLMQRIFMLPHWVAKRFPGFKAVYDRQVRRQDERAAERARSLQEIPSLFGENKLSGKDMDELKKLVWDNDGKQIAGLEGIDKFLTDEELESGRTTIKANPEWYEGYDKWLSSQPGSDAVKKTMREIRVSLDNDLMRAHNRLARMSEMGDVAIQEFRTQIGHIHNYFPHHRYGDYFIQGKDKKGEVVYREHFDALHKRYARRHFENRLEALKKEYPDTVFDLDENTKLPDEAFGRVLDPEAMEQVIKAALSKVSDKEQADRIAEVLHESVADVMKSSGWGSHAIGRKNIPGFEKDDLFRVLYDYKSGLTGWLTKMESSKDFAEALGKINAKAHPQEWSYTSQYVKDMLRNGDRVDRTVGTIKSAAFAWYLGGNIKTAVLNLTQNVIVGVPRLQMDVEGGARAYLDGAQKQIVNQYARRFTGDKGKGLSEEEARLIQDLYGDALITDAYMEEVRGQVTGGPSTRLWNKLMKVMGYPMSVAERFNRGSLALAAFRAARDGKMKAAARKRYGVEGEKATYEQANAFAEEIVRDSHFVYGKTNAPELLRSSTAGRGLGAAFTFKTFTANLLGLWSWALRTQGKEGAIMVAKGLGATAALGGLVSLPFYATLMALFQAATGDDDDWTEAIRKQLPQNTMLRDIVCYGLPAGAGVNLGGSLKMELALTGGMQKGGTPKEVLTEGIGDIIGIPWDMFVERPSKVMEAMRTDNYWRAVEEVVPTAVSNGMKAWRLATEGQKTLKGRDINDPGEQGARKLSSGEAFGKLLGFQPVSATRSYDAYTASKHSDSVRADKADEVATIMVKALDAGDSAEMVRARKVLKDWNVKMEEEGKPHMRILMKDVQKRVTQRRRKARMTPKARQKGEAFQSVWG
ncbi:Phage protein [Bilophila wadsworthia]|uniref:PLxRFG domain-containing protein n=1 Tax=Bilophila wadsworthia TaxID=35833 RepID=UPI003D6F21E3